jgi:carbamoyl-phosphate synthase small subunit
MGRIDRIGQTQKTYAYRCIIRDSIEEKILAIQDRKKQDVSFHDVFSGAEIAEVFGLAAGGTTSRLKFGHHGGNHPVRDELTGRIHITSQNHEFQVDGASISPATGFFVSAVNLNDGSVEGLAHRELPVFSVQYHPEGCPGPQDNQVIFDRFLAMVSNPVAGAEALACNLSAGPGL